MHCMLLGLIWCRDILSYIQGLLSHLETTIMILPKDSRWLLIVDQSNSLTIDVYTLMGVFHDIGFVVQCVN